MSATTLTASLRVGYALARQSTAYLLCLLLLAAGGLASAAPLYAMSANAGQFGLLGSLERYLEIAGSGFVQRSLMALVVVSSAGFTLALWASVARRLWAGARPADLWRSRFEELPPVRVLLHLGHAALWVAYLGAFAASAVALWQVAQASLAAEALAVATLEPALRCVALTIAAGWARRAYKQHIVDFVPGAPPKVEVKLHLVEDGLDPADLRLLGMERFPNRFSPHWKPGLWVRGILAFGLGLVGLAAPVLEFTIAWRGTLFEPAGRAWREAADSCVASAAWFAPAQGFVPAFLYLTVVLGGIVLRNNRHYLLISFARTQLVLAILAAALLFGAVALFPDARVMACTLSFACCAWIARLRADLVLARRHAREEAAKEAALQRLQNQGDLLAAVLDDPACTLPEIELAQIERRVAQGAANIAESDPCVVRRFGRYMRVGSLRKERCSIAMQRHLAVDRSVGLSAGRPTSLPFGGREVPMWDEELFPIIPPEGYVDREDSLLLGAEWNVVHVCAPCGGCGWVEETEHYHETEYYTDYSNGEARSASRQVQRSRRVRRTCACCAGGGRLEHDQYLITHWKQLRAASVHPPMPLTTLVDGAEEVCLARAPLMEDRVRLPLVLHARDFRSPLRQRLQGAAAEADRCFDAETASAHAHLGGRIYRAEYSVWAFHTLQVRCSGLAGRVGWFFGRRPEYYFPSLPIGWSNVSTTLFAPPLFVALVLVLALSAWQAVGPAFGLQP